MSFFNLPSTLDEFVKSLPFTKKEGWSTRFDKKYPHAWSQNKDYPCGAVYMAAIRKKNNNANDNVTEEQGGDDAEEGNEIVQVVREVPHSMEQHLDEKPLDDGNNIFLGIYDGNGCGRASVHVKAHLFNELSTRTLFRFAVKDPITPSAVRFRCLKQIQSI
ncbi:hypothetical protein A2U01_0033387, partial [Trifolium medium]|nr:hypothetical protein [Trifolium medium]